MFSYRVIPEPYNRSLWLAVSVSFLWSCSSLMVFSLFPAFLKDVLKMSGTHIGLMEGLAIFLSFSMRLFSGILSDRIRSRKPFILTGAVLSTIIKPAFALAFSPFMALFVRVIDRASKGVRAAPMDALVSDLSPKENRGAAFGLRQSMKTLGVIMGGIFASLAMHYSGNNYRLTFFLATIPAALSIILAFCIKQPTLQTEIKKNKPPSWTLAEIKKLPPAYWHTILFCSFLFVAYFSEFFITLHLKDTGIPVAWLPLLIVGMNLIHAFSAFPFGKMSDTIGRRKLLALGVTMLIGVNILFSMTSNLPMLLLGILLIGVHMGVTRSLIRTSLAEHVPATLRGTAYAVFYFLTGFSLLAANILAGKCSELYGSKGPFMVGVVFASLALVVLLAYAKDDSKKF